MEGSLRQAAAGPAGAPLVVHIIHRLDVGGMENGLINLINGMAAESFRHAIVALAGVGEFRSRLRRSDVPVLSLDKRPGKDLRAYARLWDVLRTLRGSIVHTRNLGTIDCQWVAAAAGAGRRIHGEHGWDISDLHGVSRRSVWLRRCCGPVIQRYVAMSRDIQQWLVRTVGVAAARVTQIYNGVDTQRFAPEGKLPADLPWTAREVVTIGTVGRLEPTKNQILLLRAFPALLAQLPELAGRLRLIIAGGGPQHRELCDLARELGIADRVWIPGVRNDVADLLRAMDIFVLPSLNEGISNTILEAMASGRPVVAGRVGGNPELVLPETTGSLFDPRRPEDLTAELVRYVRDPDMRCRLGAAGRERALRSFSLPAMIGGYQQLYQQLLQD
jgi:sugar transferase (PEP-CTERM/EpsH1 system associated)